MQNFKIISFILLCACSHKMFGMLQRKAFQAASSVATSLLLDSKRFLCGNQANDPMWLKANHQVEKFHKKHGFDVIDAQQLQQIEADRDQIVSDYLKKSDENPNYLRVLFDNTFIVPIDSLRPIVESLLIKHGLDPAKVIIKIDQYAAIVSPTGAGTIGNTLIFGYRFTDNSSVLQIAVIEKLLGNMLCHDSAQVFYLKKLLSNPDLAQEYDLLKTQRSDTHSALQSLENAKALLEAIDEEEKPKHLQELFAYMSKIK